MISLLTALTIIIVLIHQLIPVSSSSPFVSSSNSSNSSLHSINWPSVPLVTVFENLVLSRFYVDSIPETSEFSGDLIIRNCTINAIIIAPDPQIIFKDNQRILIENSVISVRNNVRTVRFNCPLEPCGIEVRSSTFALTADEQRLRNYPGTRDYAMFAIDSLRWSPEGAEKSRSFIRIVNNTFSSDNMPRELIESGQLVAETLADPACRSGFATRFCPTDGVPLALVRIKVVLPVETYNPETATSFESLEIRDNTYFSDIGGLRFFYGEFMEYFRNIKLLNFSANKFYIRGQRRGSIFSLWRLGHDISKNYGYNLDAVEQILIEDNVIDFEEPSSTLGNNYTFFANSKRNETLSLVRFFDFSDDTTMSSVGLFSIARNTIRYVALYDATVAESYSRGLHDSRLEFFRVMLDHGRNRRYPSLNFASLEFRDNHLVGERINNCLGFVLDIGFVRNLGSIIVSENSYLSHDLGGGKLVALDTHGVFDMKKVLFSNNSFIAVPWEDQQPLMYFYASPSSSDYKNNNGVQPAAPPPVQQDGSSSNNDDEPSGPRTNDLTPTQGTSLTMLYFSGETLGINNLDEFEFSDNFMIGYGNGSLEAGYFGSLTFSVRKIIFARNNVTLEIRGGYLSEEIGDQRASKAAALMITGRQSGIDLVIFENNTIVIRVDVSVYAFGMFVGTGRAVSAEVYVAQDVHVFGNNVSITKTSSEFSEQVLSGIQMSVVGESKGFGSATLRGNNFQISNSARCPFSGCSCAIFGLYHQNASITDGVAIENNDCVVSANGNAVAGFVFGAAATSFSSPDVFDAGLSVSTGRPAYLKALSVVMVLPIAHITIRNNTFNLSNNDLQSAVSFTVSGRITVGDVFFENNRVMMRSTRASNNDEDNNNNNRLENSQLILFTTPVYVEFAFLRNTLVLLANGASAKAEVVISNRLHIEGMMREEENEEEDDSLDDCGEKITTNTIALTVLGELRIANIKCKKKNVALPDLGNISINLGIRQGAFLLSTGRWKSSIAKLVIVNSSMKFTSYCVTTTADISARSMKAPLIVGSDGPIVFSQQQRRDDSSGYDDDVSGDTTIGEIIFDQVSFDLECFDDSSSSPTNGLLLTAASFGYLIPSSPQFYSVTASGIPQIQSIQLPPATSKMNISRSNFTISKIKKSNSENSKDFSLISLQPSFTISTHQQSSSARSLSSSFNLTNTRVLMTDENEREIMETAGKILSHFDSSSAASSLSLSSFLLIHLRCMFWNKLPVFLSSEQVKASDSSSSIKVDPCSGFQQSVSSTLSDIDTQTHEVTQSRFTPSSSSSISLMEPELDPTFSTKAATDAGLYSTLFAAQPTSLLLTVQGISLLGLAECRIKSSSRRSVRIAKENATRDELLTDLEFPEILIPNFRIGSQLGGSHRAAVTSYLILFFISVLATLFLGTLNKSKWKEFCNKKEKQKNATKVIIMKFDYSLSFVRYAPFDKTFLKVLVIAVAFVFPTCGVLVAEAPSGAGDVVLGVSLCVLLALSSLLFARTLFSFVSEKTKHNNQRQRRKSYENDGDVDDEKEDDKSSTPLHFSEDSGLYFPKSDSALGAVKNKILIFLQAKIGRYLMIGQEAWETPYFDFESNLAQPGPGERTQLFELFQKYRGPLKKEEKEEETKNTKTKRNRRQQASHEFEEELLEYSAFSLTTNRRSGNRSSSSSRDRNHHRHRSSSSRNDIYNHNNSKRHKSSSPSSPRSNIVTTTNRKFQDNLKSQLLYDIAPPVSKSSSAFNNKSPPRSSRQQQDSRHRHPVDDRPPYTNNSKTKPTKRLVYDFSLRRRLCTSWFFISLVITAIVAILAGTGRANSDNCFGAFIGAFVLSSVSCLILAWLRPYIIPWMNATSIALAICNVIGGLAFLYVFVSTQPESENDDSVGQKLMEFQGWIRFAQVMCSFPAAILGPIILAVKVLRVGFLMISKSKIVTKSALRSRMIAELDDIEKSMSLGDFAANLAENKRNGGKRNQSSQHTQENSSGSKGRRRSSAGQQQSWFFGLFS